MMRCDFEHGLSPCGKDAVWYVIVRNSREERVIKMGCDDCAREAFSFGASIKPLPRIQDVARALVEMRRV